MRSKKRRFLLRIISFVALISVSVCFFAPQQAYGANYSFTQNSWTGGVSGSVATHGANQTSWNNYSAATSNVSAGANIAFGTPTQGTFTDDGLTSTNSALPITGGGFSNGSSSQVTVNGSGAGASIGITSSVAVVDDWDRVAPIPTAAHTGSQMIRNGSDDSVYVLPGDGTAFFYRYSVSGNIWTSLTNVPYGVAGGSLMTRNGSDDEIYVASGNYSGAFYRYSISGNSWTTLTFHPASMTDGSRIIRNGSDDEMYMIRGGTSSFYKYSIAGDSWTTLTSVPGGTSGDGVQMIRNGADNDIYLAAGGGTGFYKYSISGDSWTTLATTPGGSMGYGTDLLRDGSSDTIYLLQGEGTGFHKYSIAGNSWTTLAAVPNYIRNSGQMIRNGSDDEIYVLPGWGPAMQRYTISTDSWTSLANVPVPSIVNGAQMIRNGADNELYVLTGAGTNGFVKYSISTNTWKGSTVSNTLSSPVGADLGGQMIRNGSDNEIYMLPGDLDTHLYKYSIAANTWTTLAAAPGWVSNGGQMIRNGSDDAIYVMAGYSVGFYRYSIAGNSWTTLNDIPAFVSNGGQMIRNGADNDIYIVPGNSSSGFYKYSISGDSWTTLTNIPTIATAGCHLKRISNSNDIYVLSGNSSASFYKYSISGDSWTTLTSVPETVTDATQMIYNDGDNNIYMTLGSYSTSFYKYSISGNSWTALTAVPGNANAGSALIRNGLDDDIYVTQGGSSNFYKYSISGNSWTAFKTAFGGFGEGARMIRNGSDNEIYISQGGHNTGFYKFIINKAVYALSGNYTSAVVDFSTATSFSTINNGLGTSLPAQTGITYDVRAGDVSPPDGSWTSWTTSIASGGSIASFAGKRYVQYRAMLVTNNILYTPTLAAVDVNFDQLNTAGNLTSSVYDFSATGGVFTKINWTATNASGANAVRMQMRSSVDNSTWSAWCGYADCLGTTYFDTADNGVALSALHPLRSGNDDRYFQYKVFLVSDGATSPVLTAFSFDYGLNIAPSIQNVTASQNTDGKVDISYDVKDTDTTMGIVNSGFITPSFEYWNGSSWVSVTTMTAGTANQSVNEVSFTTHTAIWNAPVDFGGQNLPSTVKIRVTASDNEAARPTASAESSAFSFDTLAPTITNIDSVTADGTYAVSDVISIDVTFSEAVTSTGLVTVTLETGSTDRTCTFSVSNASTASCNYTVQTGDTSADLNVNTVSGTIVDQKSNPMSNFVPAVNLATNKAIVVDTADTIAPTVPTSLNATAISTTAIDLSWTVSTDNVGVTGYTIYRDAVEIGSSAIAAYSDTGLTPATSYTYTVAAYDALSNTSAQSGSATASTWATIAITTPSDVSMGMIPAWGQSDLSSNVATWNIKTDNATGYDLTWQASSASMTSGADTIAPYTPSAAGVPETWSVANTASEWGAHLGSSSTTINTSTWGSADTYAGGKWLNVNNVSPFSIANRSTPTSIAGDDEVIYFGAEIGSMQHQSSGAYTVDVTVTATTL